MNVKRYVDTCQKMGGSMINIKQGKHSSTMANRGYIGDQI